MQIGTCPDRRHNGKILFLDVASAMGVAEGMPGQLPILSTVNFSGDHDEDVFGAAIRWLNAKISADEPLAIWIEAPISMGAGQIWGKTNSKTQTRLVGLWASLAGLARARSIPCHKVAVQTIRAFTLNDGWIKRKDAKRETVYAVRALGCKPKNYDEADAAAGFFWASSLYKRDQLSLFDAA